jgi:hypothetical protein
MFAQGTNAHLDIPLSHSESFILEWDPAKFDDPQITRSLSLVLVDLASSRFAATTTFGSALG